MFPLLLLVGLMVLPLSGCRSAYYGFWERLGLEKRDLLVDRVEDARDAQSDASEEIQDTYERFVELTGAEGGELADRADALERQYERSVERAEAVRTKIADVESVAEDLFEEWEDELEEYQSSELRRDSERQLELTRERYAQLMSSMRRAEGSMEPVLEVFQDYVLRLRHERNAQAIGSLEGVSQEIEQDVASLVSEMRAAIAEADEFLEQMGG
jgi:hypothetical protein